MVAYTIVPLLESDKERAKEAERTYFSRTNAEHVCSLMNKRKPIGHPGYTVEKRDTPDPKYCDKT
jgi:hypothetical protein